MKKKFFKPTYLLIVALLSGVWVSSCSDSFLNAPPKGSLGTAQVLNQAGIESLLIGAYSALKANGISSSTVGSWSGNATNWVFGSVCSQETFKGSNSGDQSDINPLSTFTCPSTNTYIIAKWGSVYDGVNRANQVLINLKLVPSGAISASDVQRITGEARFLRAYFLLEAYKVWKNIPYVDETISYANNNYNVPNTVDVLPKIIADFDAAYQALPETMPAVGRANKWAAYAFEGKCKLYQKDYTGALAIFNSVMQNGKTAGGVKYALMPKYRDLFDAATDNNAESIFAIQSSVNDGSGAANADAELVLNYPYGGNSVVNCCGFNTPTLDMANSYRLQANGLPYLDAGYNAKPLSDIQWNPKSKVNPTRDTGPLDPRIDWTLGRTGVPFLDWGTYTGPAWVRDFSDDGPYSPKKYDPLSSEVGVYTDKSSWTPGYEAVNQYLMRYADVLLMAAECEVEAGSLTNAQTLVNMVRARQQNPASWVRISTTNPGDPTSDWAAYTSASGTPAGNYSIMSLYGTGGDNTFSSQSTARKAVHMERKLELCLEGHRFFDLVRWGETISGNANGNGDNLQNAFTYNVQYAGSGALGTTFYFKPGKSELFPIPQSQIDLSQGVLKQNPGY